MKLAELEEKTVLILGLGVEGLSTFKFLRELYPAKLFGVADRRTLEQLDAESREAAMAGGLNLHLGEDYLSVLASYEIIIKTPGISIARNPEIKRAVASGSILTSHTALFFANCPGRIIGVTGTKGKGTTSKLIHAILKAGGFDAHLVGNIGNPPLPLIKQADSSTLFVYELSAQQLETLDQSPHIAVLLNIVTDHLDHFVDFDAYLRAKRNLAIHQTARDLLIYNAAFDTPRGIASEARSRLIPYSKDEALDHGCFVEADQIVCRLDEKPGERVISVAEVAASLPGPFNLHNVLPAVAVGKLLGVSTGAIVAAIGGFQPLAHRFERAGVYRGITFYNASISTVPEVTIEHMNALGGDVETLMLGGQDRSLDFTMLAKEILASGVKNCILFPDTGRQIWDTVCALAEEQVVSELPRHFFLDKSAGAEAIMEEAVRLAYQHTQPGKICLHSPASSSYSVFKNFKHRGELFNHFVKQMGEN